MKKVFTAISLIAMLMLLASTALAHDGEHEGEKKVTVCMKKVAADQLWKWIVNPVRWRMNIKKSMVEIIPKSIMKRSTVSTNTKRTT